MAKYRYAGPGPIEILSGGELIRPGDVREFDEEPTWGPWEQLDIPGQRLTDMEAGLVTAEQQALSSDQGLAAPPTLSTLTTPPAGTEGM